MAESSATTAASGPLVGVRIVEFAGIGPGPFAAMLLADMGAEIVRIERPGTAPSEPGEIVNRGRTAVVQLDLKSQSGCAQALDLVAKADALIEGFRPGVMERLGLGPEVALGRNPRLVYGRMTGWGQTGPLAQSAGHDINYISLPGALAAMGDADRPPPPPLNLVGDYGGGSLYLVMGLLAGILSARSTGDGQVVDAAMVDGCASLMAQFFALRAMGKWTETRRANLLDGGTPFYASYECADGKFVSVGPLEPQFFGQLTARLGVDDPCFERQDDEAGWPRMRAQLGDIFKTRPRDEWNRIFDGTDCCVAPVLTMSEAPSHPHLALRQTFLVRDDVVQPAPAPRFSRTPSSIQSTPALAATDVGVVLARWNDVQ